MVAIKGPESMNNPVAAGIETSIAIRIPHWTMDLNWAWFCTALLLERFGKTTVDSATPKTPTGNSSKRSE